MATRPFSEKDKAPLYWSFGGGRHNNASRHRGTKGFWYLVQTFGSGRTQNGWTLMVFPDSIRISAYAGRDSSRVITKELVSNALLVVGGSGGFDTGKSATSKGGYRPGHSIQYEYDGQGFDPDLLDDGDEFILQVLKYELSVEGIKHGIARDQLRKDQLAAEKKAADEAWSKAYDEKRAVEKRAYDEAIARYTGIFRDVQMPGSFRSRITSEGLKVFRDRGGTYPDWMRYYDVKTLTSIEAYQTWLVETEVMLRTEEIQMAEAEKERLQREEEKRLQGLKVAAEKATIEENLDDLADLLSKI